MSLTIVIDTNIINSLLNGNIEDANKNKELNDIKNITFITDY
mgnify:CR=1 FL=1